MLHKLNRTLIAGAAITGALTFGAAGLAGASTPAGGPAPSTATTAQRCAKAEARVPKIEAREAKAATFVTAAEGREAKAKAAGHTKVAARIQDRINRVEKAEARGKTLLAKIAAKCGGSTSTATS
jgi:hypothetical protein